MSECAFGMMELSRSFVVNRKNLTAFAWFAYSNLPCIALYSIHAGRFGFNPNSSLMESFIPTLNHFDLSKGETLRSSLKYNAYF